MSANTFSEQNGEANLGSNEFELAGLRHTGVILDKQLEHWAHEAEGHRHPAIRQGGGLAAEISRRCRPQPEEVIEAARSETSPFPETAALELPPSKAELKARREREILRGVAGDEALDMIGIANPLFGVAFERYRSIQSNPGVSEPYRDAITALYRIYVQREYIAERRLGAETPNTYFMLILNRLLDDLF